MEDIAKCLSEIEKVKEVAEGQAMPYAARSRLARLTLDTTRLACAAIGVPLPDRPGTLPVMGDDASTTLARVVASCDTLNQLGRSVAQPSEPLEARWRTMWQALLRELDELDAALRAWQGELVRDSGCGTAGLQQALQGSDRPSGHANPGTTTW